jgi:Predicted secreted protein
MKKILMIALTAFVAFSAFGPVRAFADSAPGDVIVTLGANLTADQRQAMLNEMGVSGSQTQIVTVTNSEEHKYLDNYLSPSQIGTRAISSSKITLGQQGSGLTASTHNITYVTKDMYINAMATAGVKDADVYVTAPFPVSGTAALTGIIKAYEVKTGTVIPEAKKQVANQEVVTTAEIGNQQGVGKNKATQLVTTIKDNLAKNTPQSRADIEKVVRNSAQQVGVQLSDADIQKLVDLFDKMRTLNINWNQVGSQMQQVKNQISQLANSSQAGGFLNQVFTAIGNFFSSIFKAIASLF